MGEIVTTKRLDIRTVMDQVGRLACHYPNSGHTDDSMAMVSADWFREFSDKLTNEGFIRVIEETLRKTRFFPVIADITEAMENSTMCQNCVYRSNNVCSPENKQKHEWGNRCTAFVNGDPQGVF